MKANETGCVTCDQHKETRVFDPLTDRSKGGGGHLGPLSDRCI